jgi:tRNA-2-methylthio-N6-dimethylallyladenosine synthase
MNVLDSELVVGALRQAGYELTGDLRGADTVLFNTCSVREHAEHKIYSQLGRIKYLKRRRPNCVIGVMGCMAQKDQELIFQRAPHVDLVVGTGQLGEIPRLIEEVRASRRSEDGGRRSEDGGIRESSRPPTSDLRPPRLLAVSLDRKDGPRSEVAASFESYDPLREPAMRPSPFQAFVRIMIGCDKFCTYCVVPMTRGPEQSRPPSHIRKEVAVLAGQGVKEVTLLGQTVNSYRHTEGGRLFRLSDLLEAIHDTPGIERIKFVTNYPRDMSDDLLQAIRDLPKVARYLHVPLQHGCDDVLKVMKRGYTVGQYREMMHRIWETFGSDRLAATRRLCEEERGEQPTLALLSEDSESRLNETTHQIAVSSDFIVGHSGETEAGFEKCLDAVREFRFKNSFIFKYSPRPGTKAFDLYADEIPEEVKRRRNNELLRLQNEISEEDNAEFIGRRVQVLVEGLSKAAVKSVPDARSVRDAGPMQLVGRTRCDRIVVFDGNPRLAGSLVDVDVDDCTATTLMGRIVTREVQHGCASELPILQL